MSRIARNVESLAKQAPPDVALEREDLDAIVHLARELAYEGKPLAERLLEPLPSYRELPEAQRQNMRAGAMRVVQAMVMLGWIESPA